MSVFRYPALSKADSKVYAGHASHVLGVRFTPDERFVISIGGEDSATLQWRFDA
jgi:hypothetical protein